MPFMVVSTDLTHAKTFKPSAFFNKKIDAQRHMADAYMTMLKDFPNAKHNLEQFSAKVVVNDTTYMWDIVATI